MKAASRNVVRCVFLCRRRSAFGRKISGNGSFAVRKSSRVRQRGEEEGEGRYINNELLKVIRQLTLGNKKDFEGVVTLP